MSAETVQITSKIVQYGQLDVPETVDAIKAENMFFQADKWFAWAHGNTITRRFVEKVDELWLSRPVVIDTRYHMLMPGWYPCIPGWHVDEAPRTRANNQPNHTLPGPRPEHMCMVVDTGTGSLTEYALGSTLLPEVVDGDCTTYGLWNDILEGENEYPLKRYQVRSKELIRMDMHTLHRGMPAVNMGWRIFLRATLNSTRPIVNEIRKQTQVYMSALNAGW